MCVMELLKDVDFTYMGYILLLGLGLIVLQIMVRTLTKSRRKARKPETYLDLRKPEDQIAAISKVDFERVPLLNKPEKRVMIALEAFVAEFQTGHRVMA